MHKVPFFSCSLNRAMTLDTNSMVWTFLSWGRPFRLVSPLLDCLSPETTPIQIECDIILSAALTRSGDVCVWWLNTIEGQYRAAVEELDKDESTKAIVPEGGMVIPCHTLEIHEDPIKLPALPDLPALPGTGLSGEECWKETKLIKIAALTSCLIGLTNKGHVLKIDSLDPEYILAQDNILVWKYVSKSAQMI